MSWLHLCTWTTWYSRFSDITESSIHLTWTPPEDDGGAEVTEYMVEFNETSSKKWKVVAEGVTDLTYTVKKLVAGSTYQFRVTAKNKAGYGAPSESSGSIVAKPQYAKWTPPASDGGSPITNYVIEKRDTARDRWSKATKEPVSETTFTITDLIEGNEYEFRISTETRLVSVHLASHLIEPLPSYHLAS
ncbi:immunoglobulin superfamily member 22-like [Ptychodera flava]|uniref:immunoglobulin superfamily member 22-like n=1 Tax=Ptychodera flava TaxID=63121 RepID=UPI00396A5D4B